MGVAVEVKVGVVVYVGDGEAVSVGSRVKGDADGDGAEVAVFTQAARIRLAAKRTNTTVLATFMPARNPRAFGWISGHFFRV